MPSTQEALKQLEKWEYYDATTGESWSAIPFVNKTGSASVKGSIVEPGNTVDNAVKLCGADEPDPVGVIVEDGIADGDLVWVAIKGTVKVLIEDSTTATREYWVRASATVPGRADATNAAPSGGTISQINEHFREIGHCLETVSAGTDKLALVHIHFN